MVRPVDGWWRIAIAVVVVLAIARGGAAQNPVEHVVLPGIVVDMRGEPVVLAEVEVAAWSESGVVVGRATTDATGVFRVRVPKLPLGEPWAVAASAAGMSRDVAGSFGSQRPVRLTLHDAVTLRGRILDADGRGAADVVVTSTSRAIALRRNRAMTTTATDGSFELPHVPIGPVTVGAFVEGVGLMHAELVALTDTAVELELVEGPQTELRIAIEGLGGVAASPDVGSSRVAPSVQLDLRGGGSLGSVLPSELRRLRVGADGVRVQNLPDRRYVIDARGAGHAVVPQSAELRKGDGPHEVTLTVIPPAAGETTVNARLTTRAGEPLGNVAMRLVAFGPGVRKQARSDDDGRVTFRVPLASGAAAFLVSADNEWIVSREVRDGHSGALAHELVIDPESEIDVVLVPAARIAGRVTGADGEPARFVELALAELMPGAIAEWRRVELAHAGLDGSFVFSPQPARRNPVRVEVASRLGTATTKAWRIEGPGAVVDGLEIDLAAPAVLAGVVHGPDSEPMAGVTVTARLVEQRRVGRGRALEPPRSVAVVTDREGRYRIVGVHPGEVRVEVTPGGRATGAVSTVAIAEGQTLSLDFTVGRRR